MAKARSYKLLCPIARGLDRVGDRWTLLILRDLHAGPARFSDLQHGLTGIAPNLLTDRLTKLVEDGLVEKQAGEHGAALYRLTEAGERTRDLLFDLALFGSRFSAVDETVDPGNLRTVAMTLGTAVNRVATPYFEFTAAIIVDSEAMTLWASGGKAGMRYEAATSPDLILETGYQAMLSMGEGEITLEDFIRNHATIEVLKPGKDAELSTLLSRAMELFSQ